MKTLVLSENQFGMLKDLVEYAKEKLIDDTCKNEDLIVYYDFARFMLKTLKDMDK